VRTEGALALLAGFLSIFLYDAAAARAEVTGAIVVLEDLSRGRPDQRPAGAPVRFALLDNGQVFVGSTREIYAGQLTDAETKDLEKRINTVRKLPGIGGTVTLGPGSMRHHLELRKGRALDITVMGDPAAVTSGPMAPLAALVRDLSDFIHPSLKPYAATSYLVSAAEQKLPGGCKWWTLKEPVTKHVFSPGVVAASEVVGWPTGASPASVCGKDGGAYAVTFRPLLPGETH